MRRPRLAVAMLLSAVAFGACGVGTSSPTPSGQSAATTRAATQPPSTTSAPTDPSTSSMPSLPPLPPDPEARTILVDTDVAADDLVALTFLVRSPHLRLAAISVSGTGEAHCDGGVDVVLRLLDALAAPDIPVACGRETPLEGDHAFPAAWREHVDGGSGLELAPTSRTAAAETAVELISRVTTESPGLTVLTLGPVTNLAEALLAEPALADRLGPVFVMGGALHVPGNLVCCGAPEDNGVAEWNIYVDPHAAQALVESGVQPSFVSLDGTNQVPVTPDFAARALEPAPDGRRNILAEIFTANAFMTEGSYYLWDPLAAALAAGHPIGTFEPASIVVEESEGPESGFTRPTDGTPNMTYLATVDRAAAEATLLRILRGG